MSTTKTIISLILTMTFSICATAQEMTEDSTASGTSLTNPEKFQVQEHYFNHKDYELFPKKPGQRFFVGAGAGLINTSDRVDILTSPRLSVYGGYRFTPIHSIRLEFGYSSLQKKKKWFNVNSFSLGVDYLASMSDFLNGVNPRRVFNWSTMIGFGGWLNHYETTGNKLTGYLKGGLHMDFHFSNRTSLYLEPYVGFTGSQNPLFGNNSAAGLNTIYGVMAGLQYQFEPNMHCIESIDNDFHSWFADASIGWQLPLTGTNQTSRSGMNVNISAGKWLTPVLGFRAGLTCSEHETVSSLDQHIVAARLELVLDPLNMFTDLRERDRWFDLNVLSGGSIGEMLRGYHNRNNRVICTAWSVDVSLQPLFRVYPHLWIYLEPRYEHHGYYLPKGNREPDNTFTLSAGTRFYF